MTKKRQTLNHIPAKGSVEASKAVQTILKWLEGAEIQGLLIVDLQVQATKNLIQAVDKLRIGDYLGAQKLAKVALVTMDQLKD